MAIATFSVSLPFRRQWLLLLFQYLYHLAAKGSRCALVLIPLNCEDTDKYTLTIR